MMADRGARVDAHAWVVAKLESWGRWMVSGGAPSGYGQSCLTIEEIRSLPVQAYIPMSPPDCERTHEAVRKLPDQLQKLAVAWYVDGHLQRVIARKLRVSERHLRRMHESLLVGVGYCLKNQSVKYPPLHLLLK